MKCFDLKNFYFSSDHVENFYALKRTKAFRWIGNRTRHFFGHDYIFTEKNDAMCRQIHTP